MIKLLCDQKLIMEANKFAAGEIHDVTNVIASYEAAAELFNKFPKRYKKFLISFKKQQRILRVFVLMRKLKRPKTLDQIKIECARFDNNLN